MKIWIGYGSKYGYTRKLVDQLGETLSAEVVVCDLSQDGGDGWQEADAVILGGSVYAGKLRKEVKRFAEKNKDELMKKPLGLFLTGMQDKEDSDQAFMANYDGDLLSAARVRVFLGGGFQMDKMNFLEKTIIKKIAKGQVVLKKEYPEEIERMAEAMC